MTPKMPRGAIPTPRSEFAASEPYRPEGGAEILVPSGEFPTPNQELAAAQPYRASGAAPESFIRWPIRIGFWGNDKVSNSSWAEEAFAKACAEPKVSIPTDVVLFTSQKCGSSNFAAFMQTHGFQMDRKAYLDGAFNSVDWTNAAALNGAIANVGPVKIGVASANLASGPQGQVTPGTSGWAICGLPASLKITARAFAATARWRRWSISSSDTRSMSICRRACLPDFATRCSLGAPSASSISNR